ncbi:MAG: hypothetical protein HY022_08580 [Chloroflexi bacterium]|nr:hypothetical protein [Chloroflexota bacterium]
MNEYTGWLLDLYPHPEWGIVLWLLCDDGQRRCLRQDFPVTFYAAGPDKRLRALWLFLREQSLHITPSRENRRDLFAGMRTVLAATLHQSAALPDLHRKITEYFPDLILYDIDFHVALRHAAVYRTFPMARCHVVVDEENIIQELHVLDSKWELDPQPAPLRVLTLELDTDPFHRDPKEFIIGTPRGKVAQDINDPHSLGFLNYVIQKYDPDLILSSRGETYLLPLLLERAAKYDKPLQLNRDPDSVIGRKKARPYFAYGQVIYRGQQVLLKGRLHLDTSNISLYGDYGIDGVLEMARVTSQPIQTAAHTSPGTGISAMQVIKALELGILVPVYKEQVEDWKTTAQLYREDMGGTVYDPILGLHPDAAEIDFSSMYPSLMKYFNISPETVNSVKPTAELVSELGMIVDRNNPGLIPQTLAPLIEKRLALKDILLTLSPKDCRYERYDAACTADKWLLITCFGYLNFHAARFGKVEAHEAVTAYSRECMLRAKEAAEDLGFRVLHIYVDGMWIHKLGCRVPEDYKPLLDEIQARTNLRIGLEGVYKWVAFPSSKRDKRNAVPTSYFGIFQNGEIKTRGIENRRHDMPSFISEAQMEILEILNKAPSGNGLMDFLSEIQTLVQQKQAELRDGRVPLEKLLVHQWVSRNLNEYRAPTPAANAMKQLEGEGKSLNPGQSIRFLYIRGKQRARAWDLSEDLDQRTIDLPRYTRLLTRAIKTILEPVIGVENISVVLDKCRQLPLAM